MSTGTCDTRSLPPCAICHINVAIYRCPRCFTRTCSLGCSRAHKVSAENRDEIVCDGKRDRTQFCSLKDFTDSQLASDYYFLEDVLNASDSSKRCFQGMSAGDHLARTVTPSASAPTKRTKINTHKNRSGKLMLDSISANLPTHPLIRAKEGKSSVEVLARGVHDDVKPNETQHFNQSQTRGIVDGLLATMPAKKKVPQKKERVDHLVRQSELRGIHLLRMPNGMERRRSNTTKTNKNKGITWKIELCFHHANSTDAEGKSSLSKWHTVENEVSELSILSEEVGKHLDALPASLRAFAAAPRASLALFLKRLPCSAVAPRYFALDPQATLGEALRGKTIIEFPTVEVALDADRGRFPLFIEEVSLR